MLANCNVIYIDWLNWHHAKRAENNLEMNHQIIDGLMQLNAKYKYWQLNQLAKRIISFLISLQNPYKMLINDIMLDIFIQFLMRI